ncbi:uncharacterized protein LOC108595962 isoform X1 [Drosophila busckii]|uniref:uncharacterized protein LOC108595962 isoform X1 n=1 Tax=Drosophila busckii TaxID=30019 RepID=UPI00083F0881|nr:uncharacterized protein LOC108595962 isoform X1 [Drosophila busckii]
MLYTDNFCCCIDLKCGCIIIAILEVIIRGVDRFLVDTETFVGYITLIIIGVYIVSCIILLVGAILRVRLMLLPYLIVIVAHIILLIAVCIYVALYDEVYDYIIFDGIQAIVSMYFFLVVRSFYVTLGD